jgi:hypothetical protein
MSAFIAAALSFPTVVFTVLLGLFVLYAIATLIGALDIEALDGFVGVDEVSDSALEGLMDFFGVSGVPLLVFGGAATVFAWIASIAAVKFISTGGALLSTGIGIGALVLGLVGGAIAVRPLRRLFVPPSAQHRSALVGKICTVRSLRVNDATGTAELEDGGAGLIAEVRCFRDNELTLGSKAVVYDYDDKQGIYHVGPIDPSIVQSDSV